MTAPGAGEDQVERRLRAALAVDATGYDVSAGALADLRRRTRRRGLARTPIRLGLAAACAVVAVTGVAVLPSQLGGRHAVPATIQSSPSSLSVGPVPSTQTGAPAPHAAASAASAASVVPPPPPLPPLPPAPAGTLAAVASLDLGFTADRVVLAGSDAYVFGLDAAGQPVGARLDVRHGAPTIAVSRARMPGRVCSGSIDAGLLVVVLADGMDCTYRGTIYALDSVDLVWGAFWREGAREGDVLVRPEGVYDVDAGELQLRDRHTLVVQAQRRVTAMADIVNLAGDPGGSTFVATAYAKATETTHVFLEHAQTLAAVTDAGLAGATEGAIAYATPTGFWLPFTGAGVGSVPLLAGGTLASAAQAFPGVSPDSAFALSSNRLWSLDAATHALSCADLATGVTTGSTRLTGGAALAADATHVYVLPADGTRLQTLTPSRACG